jgi:putative transcriptional regulator
VREPIPTLIEGAVSLKPAQQIVLANLGERGGVELVRAEYEAIAGVSRSQAAYDIAELVALGILERVGSGRATRYRLSPSGAGRPRKWTDERIRAGLADFCEVVGHWPRAADFRRAGRTDLYLAATRNGGIERWASEVAPERDGVETGAALARSRNWVSFALVLLAALGSLTISVPRHTDSRTLPGSSVRPTFDEARLQARAAKNALASVTAQTPAKAVLKLAAREATWVSIRRGSARGPILFEGVLVRGASVRADGERLWVHLETPSALAARLNGHALRLPRGASTLLVTAKGARVLHVEPAPPPSVEAVLVSETLPAITAHSSATRTTARPAPEGPAPDPAPGAPGPDPIPRSP